MALSNDRGALVLTTGNKSEMSVGYATLYGDMAGGLAVIKDVPKQLVYALVEHRNARGGPRARSRPRCSSARPRPSCAPTSSTRTRCRPTSCSTACSRATSSATCSREELIAEGLSGGDRRRGDPARRPRRVQAPPGRRPASGSPRRPSAATGACRSPTDSGPARAPQAGGGPRSSSGPGSRAGLVVGDLAVPDPGRAAAVARHVASACDVPSVIGRRKVAWLTAPSRACRRR